MKKPLIVLIVALGLIRPAWADYQDGEAAYERGDYQTALREWRPLAEQGLAEAQWSLGVLYESGQGVAQSSAGAAAWYRKAAEQGYAKGQAGLGYQYYFGHGVPQDCVQSHMWANLAAAQGYEMGNILRDWLVPKMTSSQIAEAQRRAAAWRPTETLTIKRFKKRYPGQPVPAPQPRAAHADPEQQAHVARVQEGLTSLGYDPGPIDGIVGPKTRAAIRAFQAAHDLAVTGEVSVKLEAALLKQILLGPKTARLEKDSTGSGFLVSSKGHILTNHHVVKDCEEVRLPTGVAVQVIAGDAQSDLALLEGPGTDSKFATFGQGRGVRPGDDIVVVGFPMRS